MPRTIDDIVPPSRRRSMDTVPTENGPSFPPPPPRVKIREGRSFPYGTAIVALIVIVLSAAALYAFGGAKVDITPTSNPVTISGVFTATPDGTNGDLPFKVISVSKTETVAVPAESTQTSNDSAQGTILVTNTLTTPEQFVTNTRFQSSGGQIFRVHSPVTIPPATANGPGSVSITVFADQPGIQYNIAPTTFTVPGLTGTAAAQAVTGKSTNAFTGGFAGTRAAVSQNTDTTQQATLKAKLSTDLISSLTSQVPTGYSLIQGGSFSSYTALPDSATTTTSVTIGVQGTATAVIFPTDALAKAIAYKSVGTYQGQPVTLASTANMMLSPSSSITPTTSDASFAFSLTGNSTVVWNVDTKKIASAVAGKTRDSAQSILQSFPEIQQATLILRPFWTTTYPQDPAHIQVVVSKPAGN